MKILYLTHLYPPRHIGGTENYTHAFAKGMIARGHEVHVLCVGEWDGSEHYWNGQAEDEFEGVAVRRLHLNWTKAPEVNRYLYDNPFVADYVEKYLSEIKPDVVHVTSCNTLSASVIESAKRAGLRVVVTLTDFWFICPQVNLVRGDGAVCDGNVTAEECVRCLLYESKAYRLPKHVLRENLTVRFLDAVSQHEKVTRIPGLRGLAMNIRERRAKLHRALDQVDRVLIASHAARDLFRLNGFSMPIQVVPYGHDLAWLTDYSGKSARNVISFGFIGQLSPMKGAHLLIEAYKNATRVCQARLLIYGNLEKDPEFSRQLRALADGRNDIEFRGTYPHSESGRIFSEIDVLVVPSLWSDYPLIINEAFAAQTPVIATELGGMSEFVQAQVNGLLFERGNVEDLARQLRRAIVERDLLGRLRAGIPRVKSIAEAIDEMLNIYESVSAKQEQVSI